MKTRYVFLGLCLTALFLSGCISQTYYQSVNPDGSSLIAHKTDFSRLVPYFSQFGFESEERFKENLTLSLNGSCEKIMSKDKSTACSFEGLVLKLEKSLSSKEGYYLFEAIDSVPYKTYRVTVYKLPSDKFGKLLQQLNAEPAAADFISTSVIDLRKKEESSMFAQGFEIYKMELYYEIKMPGAISSASAGAYKAEINGTVAKFDLVKVMANSQPLVVESTELNILMIAVFIGLLVLILLGVAFFFFRKK